ncbi:MAG: lam16B [Fibrobacteres bacterium]|nr:lam16B [Fibrobacterota bacterium]
MGRTNFILSGLVMAAAICISNAQNVVNITGTVNDTKTGNPVAGAKVMLTGNPSITTMTGSDGSYKLSGDAVALASLRNGKSEMSFKGNMLSFTVAGNNTPVTVDVYNLKSELVRNLVSRNASSGNYTVNASPAGLASGLYVVRARVGKQTASFKMTTLGINTRNAGFFANAAFVRTGLAKTAADPIDSMQVTKDGYKVTTKALTKYTGIYPILLNPKLPAGDLKIVSERNMPQVDWGSNVDVQVWDGGTQLKGDYKTEPFEGPTSWYQTFGESSIYSGWGFVAKPGTPEDMSAWANGSMHIAVKGTATSIGVTMASVDQGGGFSKKVDLRTYGYIPDNKWHEASIPMTDFTGTDFSKIDVYCGLVYPVDGDSAAYDATLFYQVDDIYWKVTK